MTKTTTELLKEAGNVGKIMHSPFMMAVLINEQAANSKELAEQNEKLVEDVKMLWMLLDDIDTLDDAAKSDDSVFRKTCYKIQQKRWELPDPFNKRNKDISK